MAQPDKEDVLSLGDDDGEDTASEAGSRSPSAAATPQPTTSRLRAADISPAPAAASNADAAAFEPPGSGTREEQFPGVSQQLRCRLGSSQSPRSVLPSSSHQQGQSRRLSSSSRGVARPAVRGSKRKQHSVHQAGLTPEQQRDWIQRRVTARGRPTGWQTTLPDPQRMGSNIVLPVPAERQISSSCDADSISSSSCPALASAYGALVELDSTGNPAALASSSSDVLFYTAHYCVTHGEARDRMYAKAAELSAVPEGGKFCLVHGPGHHVTSVCSQLPPDGVRGLATSSKLVVHPAKHFSAGQENSKKPRVQQSAGSQLPVRPQRGAGFQQPAGPWQAGLQRPAMLSSPPPPPPPPRWAPPPAAAIAAAAAAVSAGQAFRQQPYHDPFNYEFSLLPPLQQFAGVSSSAAASAPSSVYEMGRQAGLAQKSAQTAESRYEEQRRQRRALQADVKSLQQQVSLLESQLRQEQRWNRLRRAEQVRLAGICQALAPPRVTEESPVSPRYEPDILPNEWKRQHEQR
jgi:hypothetical protein